MMTRTKVLLVFGVVVVVGVLGILLAVHFSKKVPLQSNLRNGGGEIHAALAVPAMNSSVWKASTGEPMSDPSSEMTALTMLAIGDWGATIEKEGSCCNTYRKVDKNTQQYFKEFHAQHNVATLLAQSAAELKPVAILSHGDNAYWVGLTKKDQLSRMEVTFEQVYHHKSLEGIPWLNTLGNHDLGGSSYICGDSLWSLRPCRDAKELVDTLEYKFDLMKNYKSPNYDRWVLDGHYYVRRYEKNGVSVEIFNVDTNHADSHGARQICCQCYGYSFGGMFTNCENVNRGSRYCVGGNVHMYDKCVERIEDWALESMTGLRRDLAKSTATYRIINTHYSPQYHMGVPKMEKWFKICKEFKVHAWINGHTHGFNHDISVWETHFFENGGGGGIQSQSSSTPPPPALPYVRNKWVAEGAPFGFLELSFTKSWIKIQFVTFDRKWKFSMDKHATKVGGIHRGHCWFIGKTGRPGRPC